MACAAGLADGIRDALELTPGQVLMVLKQRDAMARGDGPARRSSVPANGRQGTPEEFAAMFMSASQGQVAVSNG